MGLRRLLAVLVLLGLCSTVVLSGCGSSGQETSGETGPLAYINPEDCYYHSKDCPLLTSEAKPHGLDKLVAVGYLPCATCQKEVFSQPPESAGEPDSAAVSTATLAQGSQGPEARDYDLARTLMQTGDGYVDAYKEHFTRKGLDANGSTSEGFTLLALAATQGKEEIVKFLIEQGADVNVVGEDGRTALHGAAQCNRLEIARYLLALGASPSVKGKDNWL